MSTTSVPGQSAAPLVRAMQKADLAAARSILRVAFGTFIGLPDPNSFAADKDYIGTRWRANPESALVAELDGAVVGSNIATNWGSFGFFGPLTIQPAFWNRGVAQSLLAATMDLFASWDLRETGLFTFAQSAKHVHLYQKFDYWPRFLTAIMQKSVGRATATAWWKFSELHETQRLQALDASRELTGRIFDGLDVTSEIHAVYDQKLGETVLIWTDDRLDAFAVCHCGEGTEAGANSCYIKFGAVRPAPDAENLFQQLLKACEAMAAGRALKRIEAGVNLARGRAYRCMLREGYRTEIQGVALHRADLPAFNSPDVFVVDDWR